MSGHRWIGLLVLMGLCACERQEVTETTGLKGEAARNPLLAAERTLTALGMEAESRLGLLPLPETHTFLVTSAAPFAVEGPRLAAFLEWVEAGGRALVCLDGFDSPEDTVPTWVEEEGESTAVEGWARPQDALSRELGIERLPWDDGEEWLADIVGYEIDLPYESGWLTNGQSGPVGALEFERGAGTVRVLPSGRPFNNHDLAEYDHARLLHTWSAERPGVLLVMDDETGLWSLLLRRAPEALWAGLALLLLWLWRVTSRFGPIRPTPEAAVHGFTLHVAAAGRFLWRHDRGPALLSALRARTLRKAERRLHHRTGTQRHHLLDALAERTGRTATDLDVLLFSGEALRPRDLTRLVRDLVRLHHQL